MEETEAVFFRDRAAWHRWLERNHEKASEVWILTYKTRTGRRCLRYEEALEEALCFGWIDSRLRRIDDEKHMWRFVPRRPDSIWSLKNKTTAERLLKEGRMTPHGLKKIQAAKKSGAWKNALAPRIPPKMPPELKEALMKNEKAWKNFQAFAKSYQTTYIYWVVAAKRDDTKKKRIKTVVDRVEKNLKMFMA